MVNVKFLDIWGQQSVDVPDIGKRVEAGKIVSLTDDEAAILLGKSGSHPNFEVVKDTPAKAQTAKDA